MNQKDLDETEKQAIKAMRGSKWQIFALTPFALIFMLMGSLLDGAIIFLPSAAIIGFISWLLGSENLRNVAIEGGIFVGALWAIFCLYKKYFSNSSQNTKII